MLAFLHMCLACESINALHVYAFVDVWLCNMGFPTPACIVAWALGVIWHDDHFFSGKPTKYRVIERYPLAANWITTQKCTHY